MWLRRARSRSHEQRLTSICDEQVRDSFLESQLAGLGRVPKMRKFGTDRPLAAIKEKVTSPEIALAKSENPMTLFHRARYLESARMSLRDA